MAKIAVIATRRFARYQRGDRVETDTYTARTLVVLGMAKFENEADEFRKPPPKKSARTYRRRDLVAEK